MTDDDWASRAARLAENLTTAGVLHDSQWHEALCAVPRHELVPRYVEQHGPDASWHEVTDDNPAQRDTWLDTLYSNTALFTALATGKDGQPVAVSSSSQPSLMIRMLQTLNIHDGMRVLEIGTGTGYNSALLCYRLGERNVFSMDIDADLVALASQRLAHIGYHPTLVAVDGKDGLPDHAPYDRIIATCSVPAVPLTWAEQTREGGLILVDVKTGPNAGNLVALRRWSDRLEGRFLPKWAGFMAMRHDNDRAQPPSGYPRRKRALATVRSTMLSPQPWDNLIVWFLAQFHQPADLMFGFNLDEQTLRPTATFLAAPDGSWCEIDHDTHHGQHRVFEAGPHQLWQAVEDAHQLWQATGQPGWDRFGLTVT
ncbi:MAG: methyltransferase domain-containing protein, partial [Pseudonocardiaceae bacterium]